MKKILGLIVLVFLVSMSANAYAFSMLVDGNLSEWGVTPGVWGSSDWTPNAGIFSVVEDYKPGSDPQGFLNPGYGDQLFDAEAIYATWDNTNLYFAVVTGLPPAGAEGYHAAPIAIDFGSNGVYDYGISTYAANSNDLGTLYKAQNWTSDPFGGNWGAGFIPDNPSYPVSMSNPTLQFNPSYTNLVYSGVYSSTGHYVIEGYMPLSAFGSDWNPDFTMHWTETCGNDAIALQTHMPEPASMVLLGIGLFGAVIRRKELKVKG